MVGCRPGLQPAAVREACCIVDKTPSRWPYLGHLDEDATLAVAVGGNGHGARGSDEIGRLAAALVLGEAWDLPLPQDAFAPVTVCGETVGRSDYLRAVLSGRAVRTAAAHGRRPARSVSLFRRL